MKLIQEASSGTMESCDIHIRLEHNSNGGNQVHLSSVVEAQFGAHIREIILETLKRFDLEDVSVNAVDRGALDCTIVARVESAVCRALDCPHTLDWSVIHRG